MYIYIYRYMSGYYRMDTCTGLAKVPQHDRRGGQNSRNSIVIKSPYSKLKTPIWDT